MKCLVHGYKPANARPQSDRPAAISIFENDSPSVPLWMLRQLGLLYRLTPRNVPFRFLGPAISTRTMSETAVDDVKDAVAAMSEGANTQTKSAGACIDRALLAFGM